MKILLPSFNIVGENGMRDIIFTYSHLTKVKQNFFLFTGNLTDFARRALLITALKAVWLQAFSLPVLTIARRATNKKGGWGICLCPEFDSNPKSRTKKEGDFSPSNFNL